MHPVDYGLSTLAVVSLLSLVDAWFLCQLMV